ncbi:RNA-binding S4 domain-containing protein [Marinospirillum alkaliphilum]|uniref:Heat shock protein 15 n=1 Tax=Marinospirillum alkaliphilum DSM 21637 TaxID=1122209 RepID=A0A1K1ZE84_9GAMM|nr:S4 domain-containing protein [Marinospirillum alkaliphilum]SFX72019.1 heat shock protein Hsp15 [Marinospirillum alkaliphilum DSM 21637]
MNQAVEDIRLDKWLWAARFFKTRSLAKAAIENGKVRYDGQRPKVSRNVEVGALLEVAQGWDLREVRVLELSAQRGPASRAQQLYEETQRSIQRREQETEKRRLAGTALQAPEHRPDKKSRRQIHRFKRQEN